VRFLPVLVGCRAPQTRRAPTTTALFYRAGEIRSINLLLHIIAHQRASDGLLRLTAEGTIKGVRFTCVICIPSQWRIDPTFRGARRATVVLREADGSAAKLDEILRQYYGKMPSAFHATGFDLDTLDAVERIEQKRIEFQGFAHEEPKEEEVGFLQWLLLVDVPRSYVKMSFLVEGYGGSPPKEVFKWLREEANRVAGGN
jgi:hypothetical protein